MAAEIERAFSLDEIEKHLSSTVRAEIASGHSDFNLLLRGGDRRIAGSALSGTTTSPPPDSLQAEIPVRSALLATGGGTLTAWQRDSEFATEVASRRQAALQIWERDAVEAEKFGEIDLRTRAENAALLVLDPTAFDRVTRELDTMVDARAEWCVGTEEIMKSALAADGVSLVAIQRRSLAIPGGQVDPPSKPHREVESVFPATLKFSNIWLYCQIWR